MKFIAILSSCYIMFFFIRTIYEDEIKVIVRDVIEEILDIKVFASMNLLLRSKQQELTRY